jgi:hypothetical protein
VSGITLATEDELSEQVGLCLAAEVGLHAHQCLRRGGSGYLRSRVDNFCRMAAREPVVLITDLDQSTCAPALIADWLQGAAQPAGFVFRVAVREIESWLIADHEGLRNLMGPRVRSLPENPDGLIDPKRTLLGIAEKAHRAVREDLVVRRHAIASQGLGYNAILCEMVRAQWSPTRAAQRSPSLARTRQRLRELATRLAPR